MDVYLVPVARDNHELYCEVPDEPDEPADAPDGGFISRLKARFSAILAEAERERRHGHSGHESRGVFGRAKARSLRYVAESIAEQRLLWHLRRQTDACFFFPDDLDEEKAMAHFRRHLRRDFEKHRFWLVIDSLGFVASGVLFFVPGPNLVAYYFCFRMVGHYFSLRGARQGLDGVRWTTERSAPLSELRRAIDLDCDERERRVHAVAATLKLEHLFKFFQRTAIPSS
jgi:Mitochondrial K+-H+ exchange-related